MRKRRINYHKNRKVIQSTKPVDIKAEIPDNPFISKKNMVDVYDIFPLVLAIFILLVILYIINITNQEPIQTGDDIEDLGLRWWSVFIKSEYAIVQVFVFFLRLLGMV